MIKKGEYDVSWECIGCGALYGGTVVIEEDIMHLDPDPINITCFLCQMHNQVGLIPLEKDRETKKGRKIDIEKIPALCPQCGWQIYTHRNRNNVDDYAYCSSPNCNYRIDIVGIEKEREEEAENK